ncbi:MAG: M23 family metallopeptidase [Gammaproteobacteria bacterium]|nr:M23 family metallopeptidase [Gammaproteobacteria bacterium]MXY55962.1 M23 family metallopeptidase [Gammaproteobacteria bacterium]MYK45946.1 M23 family metallopeptidase [Gammaproteobacteria bacterium]
MAPLFLMLAATVTVNTGGVAALPLPAGAVDVRYGDEPALIVADHVIVGVGLNAAPGRHHVVVRTTNGEETIDFEVVAKAYPEQRLTIPDTRKVNPLPEDMERIARESKLQRAAYARRTPVRADLLPFKQPVQGIYSSPFGLRRFLNDQPRSPHSGLDIAAATGTPIAAPAPATVALTGDFFFSGNVVLLDHGGGLVTMYGHLDRIDVEEGQDLDRDDVIGTVGATGRVTGPHLHWTISIQGDRVDPIILMEAFDELAAETVGTAD